MFPWYAPTALGLLLTILAVPGLRGTHRFAWSVAFLASLLLWVPGVVLFRLIPTLVPAPLHGSTEAYYTVMGWQVLWIFLGIPLGFITFLVAAVVASRARPAGYPSPGLPPH